MTGKDILEAMSYIEDELVAEGEEELPYINRIAWKRWATLAACLVAAFVGIVMMQLLSNRDQLPLAAPGTVSSGLTFGSNEDSYGDESQKNTVSLQTISSISVARTTRIAKGSKIIQIGFGSGENTTGASQIQRSTTAAAATDATGRTYMTGSTATRSTIRTTRATAPQLDKETEQQLLLDYQEMRKQNAANPTTITTTTKHGDLIPDAPDDPGIHYPEDDGPGIYYPDAPFDEATPVYISRYLGTYHGVTAVLIGGDEALYTSKPQTTVIAGITVTIPAGPPLWLYRNGEFRTLESAYQWAWIGMNDLEEINRKLNR